MDSLEEGVSLSVLPVFDRLFKEIVSPDRMFVLGEFLSGAALVVVLGRGRGRDLSRVRTGWLEWNRDSLRLVFALSCIPSRPYPSAENGGGFLPFWASVPLFPRAFSLCGTCGVR